MGAGSDELLFEDFRARGDAAALATLYDRVAPELLRVALHLTRNPATAEDLVQATFVAAIEGAKSFDAARRVRPWLLGILANHAKELQRRAARRAVAPRAAQQPPDLDPFDAAAIQEFNEQIDAAISELPEVYQPVLVFGLKHGLSAAEIAHGLRRAPGTVRTQWVRGLELLRKKLPAGLTLSALALLAPTRGLAAIKQTVLAHPGVGATALAATGVLLMKKTIVAVGVLAMLALGLHLALRDSSDSHEGNLEHPPTRATAALEAPSDSSPEITTRMVAEHAIPTEGRPTPDSGGLELQVLWARDRTPAAGIRGLLLPAQSPNPYCRRVEVITDANGRVILDRLSAGPYTVAFDRHARDEPLVVPERTILRETIMIPIGLMVRGLVVDPRDRPVAGAEVWLGDPEDQVLVAALSDAEGRFELRDVFNHLAIGARAAGFGPSPSFQLWSTDATAPVEIKLVLAERGGTLDFRVLDPDGRPCPRATVRVESVAVLARDPNGIRLPAPALTLVTDAEGHAVTAPMLPGPVSVSARTVGCGRWLGDAVVASGNTSVEVRLPRAATLIGRVLDAQGQPVAGVEVAWGEDVCWRPLDFSVTKSGDDGSYRLEELPAGEVIVSAHYGHQRGGKIERRAICNEGATTQLDFVLAPASDQVIKGRVVDSNGIALPNWSVTARSIHREPRWWSSTRTDGEGRFTIPQVTWSMATLSAQFPGARNGAVATLRGITRGSEDVVLVVPADCTQAGTVTGCILDADGKPPRKATFHHTRIEAGVAHPTIERVFAADRAGDDGRFSVEDLAPGHYRFGVSGQGSPRLVLAERELLAGRTLELGELRIPRGGSLRAKLLAPARPTGDAIVCHVADSHGEILAVMETRDGALPSVPLVAGRYTIEVLGQGIARDRFEFAIAEGVETPLGLRLRPGQDLRILLVEPTPARSEIVFARITDAHSRAEVMTFHGQSLSEFLLAQIVIALAPGRYRIEATTDAGLRHDGPLVIDAIEPEPRVVRLELR